MAVMRAFCVLGAVAALAAGGCGSDTAPTTARPADDVPAEYRPFLRDGKVQPTGHPTLDYWVGVNVFLSTLKGPQNDLALPGLLRTLAKYIRG